MCWTCNRGNRYCSEICADLNRRQSVAEAGRRYQRTFKGALKHSKRQAVYRARLREKVTHQGSLQAGHGDILKEVTEEEVAARITEETQVSTAEIIRCSGCGRACGPFAYQGVIGRPRPAQLEGVRHGHIKGNRIRDSAVVSRREMEKGHHCEAIANSPWSGGPGADPKWNRSRKAADAQFDD